MYRFKTVFGADLKSRTFEGQQAEALSKSKALNIMTAWKCHITSGLSKVSPYLTPLSELSASVVNYATRPILTKHASAKDIGT